MIGRRSLAGWIVAAVVIAMPVAALAENAARDPTNADAPANAARLADALRSGAAFAITRHAIAPGFSDPAAFQIGRCETQRNLSDEGRAQARRIGAWFKTNGIVRADVFTSQWCRCRETARLLELGAPSDLPALKSFFEARERSSQQTRDLKAFLDEHFKRRSNGAPPLVLVTHQVNIAALVGRSTGSGETLVVRFDAETGQSEVLGGFQE